MVDGRALVLLVTVAFLTLYVIGVGGTTAAAIRIRSSYNVAGLTFTVASVVK